MQYFAIRGVIDTAKGENKPELVLKLNKEAVKSIVLHLKKYAS